MFRKIIDLVLRTSKLVVSIILPTMSHFDPVKQVESANLFAIGVDCDYGWGRLPRI
jgi:hypothetical protein